MKNIIKRGTSLLLVVAMLLSFAAVVGAEEPITTTSEKILTLTVDNVALQAGQEKYIPVKGHIASGYNIAALNFSISCTTGITVKSVVSKIGEEYGALKKVDGSLTSNVSGNIYGWLPSTEDVVYLTDKYNDTVFFWIKVEAASNLSAGSYTIQLTEVKGTPKVFSIIEDKKQVDKTIENATFNPGQAIVYPANAELPVVVLTKTTFDVPTMADWRAGTDGSHDLPKYLKIVYKDGAGNVQMDDVSSATMDKKTEGKWPAKNVSFDKYRDNRLTVNPAANDGDEGELTVTAATAKTSNVTYQVNSDVTFKVRKATSVLTSLAFTNNRIEDNANISAPKQSATQDETILGLGLEGKDQFDGDMTLTSSDVAVAFYSDAKCEESSKLDATPVGITVSNEIRIKNTLENDVWCKLTATGTAGEKQLTKTVTFKIESTKPHATRAEVVFSGNDINTTTNTVEVPVGEATKTVNISATV